MTPKYVFSVFFLTTNSFIVTQLSLLFNSSQRYKVREIDYSDYNDFTKCKLGTFNLKYRQFKIVYGPSKTVYRL